MTSAQNEVDRLIDERPGKELLTPAHEEEAFPINGLIYRSSGTTASYMIATDAGRVIVNTGMGWEAQHHKRLFDRVCPGPTPYIVTTQGHVDHVGGVAAFREPETKYVAQANNRACQADDARIAIMRRAAASTWFKLADRMQALAAESPGVPLTQDQPTPDITFDRRLALRVGSLELELIATPGGETIDSAVVWLPQHRICLISNLFGPLFPHFPNLNTLRGDKLRFVEPYLAATRTVRELEPEVLVTGRHLPIAGRRLIAACLERLHDAVDWVHRETVKGMNEGKDLYTLMREVRLPDRLRVGQGYGKVSWGVRTIWEGYTGWFQRRSTAELYPVRETEAAGDLVALAGAAKVVERARARLAAGEPVVAIQLAEAVLAHEPGDRRAREVMREAHEKLLADGGDVSFWESGWLRAQVVRFGTAQ